MQAVWKGTQGRLMTNTVFTAGYTGHTPQQLKQVAEEIDAIVFDIRFSPFSRNPAWIGANLAATLGNRYLHCKTLGNRNYRGDYGNGIMIHIYEKGLRAVQLAQKPVILLCACPHFEDCHRKVVAYKLLEDEMKYFGEIQWPEPPPKPARIKAPEDETLSLF